MNSDKTFAINLPIRKCATGYLKFSNRETIININDSDASVSTLSSINPVHSM